MKTKISAMIICVTLLVGLQLSCNDDDVVTREQTPAAEAGDNSSPEGSKKDRSSSSGRVGTCNQSFSGTYSSSGYYKYPDRIIDLSEVPAGCVVYAFADCKQVPNFFTIFDASGNTVASSGWLGEANYPGPYGSSLPSSTPATKMMSFTKGSSNTYRLVVQTQTPPPYAMRTDEWSLSLSCNCPITPPSTCSDGIKNGNETGVDCGGSCLPCCVPQTFSGSRSLKGWYLYPANTIDVSHVAVGGQVTVSVDCAQIPNRFTIKDPNGNTIISSGWIGYADYSGYHGGPINTPTIKALTFTRGNFSSYRLEVETSAPTSPTATYPYVPYTDTWTASKPCPR
jgi:hypothetical protein